MNTAGKIIAMLVWLGGLALAGSALLALTASRVGEHKSSTYGNAYTQFQNSWGGEASTASSGTSGINERTETTSTSAHVRPASIHAAFTAASHCSLPSVATIIGPVPSGGSEVATGEVSSTCPGSVMAMARQSEV